MQAIPHISKMTGKLESLKAISTNTTTNEFCIKQFLSDKRYDMQKLLFAYYAQFISQEYASLFAT